MLFEKQNRRFTIKDSKASLLFLTISFLYKPVIAQTSANTVYRTDTLKSQFLKEVTVNTSKHLQLLSPAPVQILKGEELERLNSISVADAIKHFSGVQLKDYGGIGGLKTINVRSMGTQHTAVFYDGVQLGNAQNGQVDLGRFSLENLEEIALYNGQKSEILQSAGSFASASSIFLKSKTPQFIEGKKLNTQFNLKAGSFGLINPSLLLQYKLSDNIAMHLNTSFSSANGKYKFRYTNGTYDTTAVRSNGDINSLRVETGLHGRFKNEGEWNVKLYAYDSERGLPGAVVSNKFDYSQRLWDKNLFVQSALTYHINKRYSILLNAKYADDYMRYLDPEITKDDGFLQNVYQEKEAYLSFANRYRLRSFWDIAFSMDYRYNTMNANLVNFPYPDRYSLLTAVATQFKFSQLDIQLNALNTWIKDEVETGAKPGKKQKITPALMFSWQPFQQIDFRLRSFYKSIFRLPTFNDLYFTQIGYRLLKPEYTEQYDVGFTFFKNYLESSLSGIEIQTDAYYNKVKNKIIAQPRNSSGLWSMRNLGMVDIRGLEVNIKTYWKLNSKLSLTNGLAYTYQKATDITDKNSKYYDNQIPYIPLHSGTCTIGIDYLKSGGINYSFIYTGERYNQEASIPANYVEPWYTHDFSAFYKMRLSNKELKLTAELNNLFNQYYDVVANFPMPGRNYRFTLSCKL